MTASANRADARPADGAVATPDPALGAETDAERATRAGAAAPLAAAWARLVEAGLTRGDAFADRRTELAAVREVAGADLALGRIFDGHRNALERLLVHWRGVVPAAFAASAAEGALALGVWGAEPGPADGPPARLVELGDETVLRGVKTFCSGAGLLDAAIVLVRRSADTPPIVPVLVDLRDPDAAQVDRSWFAADAMAASESHRVVFRDAPVIAVLGDEGALSADPWISGDALRSAAVWAGGADAIVEALARQGAERLPAPPDLERVGRAVAIRATIDGWLDRGLHAVEAAHAGGPPPAPTLDALRLECSDRIRALLLLAAEVAGSRGLVTDRALLQARAGLDVLLLQHRLGGVAERRGRALIEGGRA